MSVYYLGLRYRHDMINMVVDCINTEGPIDWHKINEIYKSTNESGHDIYSAMILPEYRMDRLDVTI
ncbi:hypothetical protein FWC31_03215 [Candidatus Saccharibacteria bacterium]|nr:hypothetical protein [Candidatus Saccharibacteria bacterium]